MLPQPASLSPVLRASLCLVALRASSPAPPSVPKVFTREVVQGLIDEVEVGTNAAVLKVPYFVSRRKHPLPKDEGAKMIKAAADAEEVGSKRWVMLVSIYAFGRSRMLRGLERLARDAYDDLFQSQIEALNPDTVRIVNVAMVDFLRDFGKCWFDSVTRSPEGIRSLGRVAQLYLERPELCLVDLDFGPAMKELDGVEGAREALDKVVAAAREGEKGGTYVVLKRSALIYKPWKQSRALELLQQAEPLLPQDDAPETERFYGHVVDLLVHAKRMDDAVATQKRLVALSGRGQVRLMSLREQAGEKDVFAAGVTAVDFTKIGEKELQELFQTLRAEKKPDVAQSALRAYLGADRDRDPRYELWARFTLGSLLARTKPKEAEAVVAANRLKPPFRTVKARMYFGRLERLRRWIAKSGSSKRNE